MIVGYVRVSTNEQKLDLQISALQAAGCHQIYQDHGVSGSRRSRPGLGKALRKLRSGDSLMVWSLDRLGRSLQHLVTTINVLNAKNIQFVSLRDAIDTSTSSGMLFFHILAALAEFERNLISERTIAGLEAARTRGQSLGRPPKLSPAQVLEMQAHFKSQMPLPQIADLYGVSPRTISRLRDATFAVV